MSNAFSIPAVQMPSPVGWAAAIGFAFLALAELVVGRWMSYRGVVSFDHLVLVGLLTAGVALARSTPGIALALTWLAFFTQALSNSTVILAQLVAIAWISFATARFGDETVLRFSGLSIPAITVVGAVLINAREERIGGSADFSAPDTSFLVPSVSYLVGIWLLLVALFVLAPWLIGYTLRTRAKASADTNAAYHSQELAVQRQHRAEAESTQSREIARLRESQAQLARDVHDVVGHSLAVILAQAESARFIDDTETARLREILDNVATSARRSLEEVREVLRSTSDHPASGIGRAAYGELQSLIDGVGDSGYQVKSSVVGTPQPLPPELAAVAYRVLQEMLTNAIHHGRPGSTIDIEQHWDGELRLEVVNQFATGEPAIAADRDEGTDIDSTPADATRRIEQNIERYRYRPDGSSTPESGQGQGMAGMRRRLESIGGRFDARRRGAGEGLSTFTATAWIPLRATPAVPAGPTESTPFESTPFESTPFESTPFESTPFESTPAR
ncbi:MAG: sensor histidine kinase [Nocardioides sp.]